MEPRKEESQKEPKSGRDQRKRRFQIVKLEERIAPRIGRYRGHTYNRGCAYTFHRC